MKTPEEIKKLLKNYRNYTFNLKDLLADALAYILQLERERDAAVQCIPRACGWCKHVIDYGLSNTPGCKNPECRNISGINTGWQWRGVQEVE